MLIRHGPNRICLCFKGVPIVIKLPKVKVKNVYFDLLRIAKEKDVQKMLAYISEGVNNYGSMQSWLLYGIVKNYSEYKYYKKSKLKFLVPTYFSIFGLINFQKVTVKLNVPFMSNSSFFTKISKIVAIDDSVVAYVFRDVSNFILSAGGELQILDYGDKEVQQFLETQGENIMKHFKK